MYCYCLTSGNIKSVFSRSRALVKCFFFFSHCFLQKLLHTVLELTKGFDVFHLEKVYVMIKRYIYEHWEDCDKTDSVEVISVLSYSTFCHRYFSMCAFWLSWLFSVALSCLVVCAQAKTKVRLFCFSLEDVYPYCKSIAIFGIIVGSFSRKKLDLEDNVFTHTALPKQLTLVCQ